MLEQESKGKRFWRVIVGPAQTSSEVKGTISKVKGLGYSDAYAVTN